MNTENKKNKVRGKLDKGNSRIREKVESKNSQMRISRKVKLEKK